MIRNYLLTAYRQLLKNKQHSFINFIGLIGGIVCFLLIALYINHELYYDQYHKNKKNIYRLNLGRLSENKPRTAVSAGAMPRVLIEEYPGIKNIVRFRKLPSLVTYKSKSFFEENFVFADSSALTVFSFNLVEGNPKTALIEPFTMVLTESAALRYFGRTENLLGELVQVDESMTFKVTGLVEDIPDQSHFHFEILASCESLAQHTQPFVRRQLQGWYVHYFHNYLLLDENADPAEVANAIKGAAKFHSDPELYERFGTNMGLFIQPLTDIHLNPMYGEIEPQGNKTILYVLGGVAFVVLLLACVNYANINITLSFYRKKEVGTRKTLGARRSQLAFQFACEAILFCTLTFAIGILTVHFILPFFNSVTEKQISLASLATPQIVFVLIPAIIFTGLSGGLYPAFWISRFNPVDILKNSGGFSPRAFFFRKTIVVFQFAISMVILSLTLVIFSQLKFISTKDLGLSSENTITIPTHGDPFVQDKSNTFFEQLERIPEVTSSSISELIPGETVFGIVARFEGQEEVTNYSTISVGYDYLKTYQMPLLSGRDFRKNEPMDTATERVIINETLARQLGWSAAEAIGKTYDANGDGQRVGEVIGVVRDFNFTSLKEEVRPLVIINMPAFYDKISIRMQTDDFETTIGKISQAWKQVYPTRPFEFRFADEFIERQYKAEKKFGQLFSYFAALAIVIALLGLYSMVSVDVYARLKEIGVRKVLGASTSDIVRLLLRSFLKLLSVALLISLPISVYVANAWLQSFIERLVSIEHLVLFPALAIIVAAITISFLQTRKATLMNPVDVLKNE